jgi:uncharacterized sulfatase
MRLLLCGLAALAIAMGFDAARLKAGPPNVVMLIADDQGWGDYGFMGHPYIRTPHLDKLAAESLVFPRGYVPTSLCRASLATMLTGLYPHQHRITSNDPPLPAGKNLRQATADPAFLAQRKRMLSVFDQNETMPQILAKAGYVSFQAGKWWEGDHCRCGFTDGMTHGDPAKGGRHGDEGLTIGRQGLKPVFDFIDGATQKKKPFYLWYAPMMPHEPHNPPERYLAKYRDKAPNLFEAKYAAMCEWFDATCGELLAHLDSKKATNDTIVIYVCDNGWIQNPKGGGFAPKSKRSPYDGGVRTPIMVRWPGKVNPGRSEDLASSIDLLPTILAATGLQAKATLPGLNLLDSRALAQRGTVFGSIYEHNSVDIDNPVASLQYRWVVAGDWKLIVPTERAGRGAKPELYAITRDPKEEKNLAEAHPDQLERLLKILNNWWQP